MKLLEHFKELSIYPQNAKELKGLILQLAIQGKLTAQWRANVESQGIATIDNNAKTLLEQIQAEKAQLIKDKKIKKEKALPPISQEEIPFELPESWEWTRLGEIGDWGAGATPLRSNGDFYGGEINWFKSGELNNGLMDYKSVEKITDLAIQKTSVRLNQPGDVLIAMYGATIGKTGFLKVEGATNQAVCACTCYNGMYNEYLHLLLKALKKEFLDQGEGGAQPNISRVKIRNKIFAIPPLAEQKAIVQIVDTLFKEVETLEELTQKRVQLKEDFISSALRRLSEGEVEKEWAFLQQHFSTFMTEESNVKKLRECILQLAVQGKLTRAFRERHPELVEGSHSAKALLAQIQAEKAQLIKEKKIKKEKALPPITQEEIPFELPMGWEWCRLGEVTDIIAGASFKSGDFNETGGTKCIKITNAGVREFVETNDFLPDDFVQLYPNYLIKEGDLILALTRPYIKDGLKISVCPSSYDNSLLNQRVASIRSFTEFIYHPYIFTFIQSPKVLNYYKSKFDGKSQQPNMKMGDITELLVSIPPLAEQKAIVTKVNELMALCDTLEQEIAKNKEAATKLMQSVLREVFQGKPDSVARPVSVEV